MRKVVFYVGIGILGTALVLLLLFGGGGDVAGIPADDFAQLASLTAIALLVGSAVLRHTQVGRMRLWWVAVWLAVLVALMAGYQSFEGGGL